MTTNCSPSDRLGGGWTSGWSGSNFGGSLLTTDSSGGAGCWRSASAIVASLIQLIEIESKRPLKFAIALPEPLAIRSRMIRSTRLPSGAIIAVASVNPLGLTATSAMVPSSAAAGPDSAARIRPVRHPAPPRPYMIVCPSCVPTTPISSPPCIQIGAREGIGANPFGIATLVSTLMPLVTASVVERARNGGGPGLGVVVEHDATLTMVRARIKMRKDLGIEKGCPIWTVQKRGP